MIDKQKSRELRVEVRRILMDQWDPIGVKDEPNAADEYDSYLGDILLLLKGNASVEEIANYLKGIETDRMGLIDIQGKPLVPTEARLLVAEALKVINLA
ncbi:hypothetical protein [Edaphobacter albus]|uniref:hypothetical protein n=1 Tax=Edaphobacter sp. 4G125 TaxID=2763071 RepID=UPI00164605F6|nr:hypothetical protein [Edaphobacter sp. 4G125]QNI36772.1 hypothetical protein H7846_17865 [Edaphobacter sp. 4G125]